MCCQPLPYVELNAAAGAAPVPTVLHLDSGAAQVISFAAPLAAQGPAGPPPTYHYVLDNNGGVR